MEGFRRDSYIIYVCTGLGMLLIGADLNSKGLLTGENNVALINPFIFCP